MDFDLIAVTEIDHNALDVEWLQHPKTFMLVSVALAEAKDVQKRLAMKLDVQVAEATQDIRLNPDNYGIGGKPTVADLNAALDLHTSVLTAKKRLMEQEHEVNMLAACVSALEHKKRALEGLVTLHGQQYFAGPKAPREVDAKMLEEAVKKRVRGRKEV